jgi:hypothetical protein
MLIRTRMTIIQTNCLSIDSTPDDITKLLAIAIAKHELAQFQARQRVARSWSIHLKRVIDGWPKYRPLSKDCRTVSSLNLERMNGLLSPLSLSLAILPNFSL